MQELRRLDRIKFQATAVTAALSAAAVAAAVVSNFLDDGADSSSTPDVVEVLRWLAVGFSVPAVLCLFVAERQAHRSKVITLAAEPTVYVHQRPTWEFRLRRVAKAAAETTVHLGLLPWPMIHSQLAIDWLSVLMILRGYVFIRLLRYSTRAYKVRREIRGYVARSLYLCYNETEASEWLVNLTLSLRLWVYERLLLSFFFLVSMSFLVFAYAIMLFERSEQPQFSRFGNCLYFIATTMTTVGLGDFVPKTPSGKIITAASGVLGVALTALFAAIVTNLLHKSRVQLLAEEFLAREARARDRRNTAALLIQRTWAHWKRTHQEQAPDHDWDYDRRYYVRRLRRRAAQGPPMTSPVRPPLGCRV